MVSSIKILSRERFDCNIKENGLKDNQAYICVISTSDWYNKHILFDEPTEKRIILQFDDIDLKGFACLRTCDDQVYYQHVDGVGQIIKPFNELNAKYLFDYIDNNIDKSELIIHCDTGFSRSAAIGLFISQYLDYLQLKKSFYWVKNNVSELRRYWFNHRIKDSYYIEFLLTYSFKKLPNDKILHELYKEFKKRYGFYLQEIFDNQW